MSTDVFASVVGQPRAVEQLMAAVAAPVHAYIFVGPRGAGKRRAAAVFAGELVGRAEDRDRNRDLAVREEHPDLVIFEPEGPSFRTVEADAVVVEASRASTEAGRKVILIDRFHDATPEAAAKLLKPIEEPPASIVFVLLSEEVPPEHVTIASRSTRIDFPAVTIPAITTALLDRGVPPDVAEAAVVGAPHEIKGQTIYSYVTPNAGVEVTDELRAALKKHVRAEIGPIATPEFIQFSDGLPKTRSGKIMRRILRKIAAGMMNQTMAGSWDSGIFNREKLESSRKLEGS